MHFTFDLENVIQYEIIPENKNNKAEHIKVFQISS